MLCLYMALLSLQFSTVKWLKNYLLCNFYIWNDCWLLFFLFYCFFCSVLFDQLFVYVLLVSAIDIHINIYLYLYTYVYFIYSRRAVFIYLNEKKKKNHQHLHIKAHTYWKNTLWRQHRLCWLNWFGFKNVRLLWKLVVNILIIYLHKIVIFLFRWLVIYMIEILQVIY